MDTEFEVVGLLLEIEVAKKLPGSSVDIKMWFIEIINFQKATRYASVTDVSGSICGYKKAMCSYSNVYIEMLKRNNNGTIFYFYFSADYCGGFYLSDFLSAPEKSAMPILFGCDKEGAGAARTGRD